ncbi:MAG: hypothetical protein WCF84_11410 [Anaerolineae bacterium]
MQLTNLEVSFLFACNELVIRQQEVLPALGQTLGVPPQKLFYLWTRRRREVRQSGTFANGEWRYFFHGLECDLKNIQDGRYVRIDFGPHGRIDTFTGWGVLQFIMTSKSPWSVFEELQSYLAAKPPPFYEFSGSYQRMKSLFNKLVMLKIVEVSDPDLVALVEQKTTISQSGAAVVSLPFDIAEDTWWDAQVCGRYALSGLGKQIVGGSES